MYKCDKLWTSPSVLNMIINSYQGTVARQRPKSLIKKDDNFANNSEFSMDP